MLRICPSVFSPENETFCGFLVLEHITRNDPLATIEAREEAGNAKREKQT